jgi:hypothetical protein
MSATNCGTPAGQSPGRAAHVATGIFSVNSSDLMGYGLSNLDNSGLVVGDLDLDRKDEVEQRRSKRLKVDADTISGQGDTDRYLKNMAAESDREVVCQRLGHVPRQSSMVVAHNGPQTKDLRGLWLEMQALQRQQQHLEAAAELHKRSYVESETVMGCESLVRPQAHLLPVIVATNIGSSIQQIKTIVDVPHATLHIACLTPSFLVCARQDLSMLRSTSDTCGVLPAGGCCSVACPQRARTKWRLGKSVTGTSLLHIPKNRPEKSMIVGVCCRQVHRGIQALQDDRAQLKTTITNLFTRIHNLESTVHSYAAQVASLHNLLAGALSQGGNGGAPVDGGVVQALLQQLPSTAASVQMVHAPTAAQVMSATTNAVPQMPAAQTGQGTVVARSMAAQTGSLPERAVPAPTASLMPPAMPNILLPVSAADRSAERGAQLDQHIYTNSVLKSMHQSRSYIT